MTTKLAKKMISMLGNSFRTNLYGKAAKAKEAWCNADFLNAIRLILEPAVVKCRYKLGKRDNDSLNLHLGCGHRHFEGYINIDRRKTSATDLVCDIRKLPYRDGSVGLIETYHVIEHMPRHDIPGALKEWHRILMPEGKLIIECPDFDEIVKKYLQGEERQLDGIFGLQRFKGDYHRFGYNIKRLRSILYEAGFNNVEEKAAKDHHAKDWPCIRVECVKRQSSA